MRASTFLRQMKNMISSVWIRLKYPQLKSALRCESHLTLEERVKLYHLSLNKCYSAEIGSYVGASACCFGAALASMKPEDSSKIFCIDTWQNNAMTEGNRDTWKAFRKNTDSYKKNIVPVRGFSTDVVGELKGHVSNLDLLFIDGDHSYEGVKADWEAYKVLLREGSTVIFHDIGWAEGVKRVVQEDVEPLVRESGRLPNLWWGVLAQKP